MSRFLLPLLLAAASAAAADDAKRTPVGRAVEALIAEADLVPMPAPSEGYLFAAAEGGIMGWGSFRLDLWLPALDGNLSDQAGGSVEVTTELGLDSTEVIVVPRMLLSMGRIGLLVDAYRFQTEGNGTITGTFTFGGIDFTVNENVQSDLDITNIRGLMTVAVIDNDVLRISLMGGISYYDFNVTVTGQLSGTGSVSAPVPVPLLGVLGQAKFGPLLLEVEVSGLTAAYGDFDISYLDVQASVGFQFLKIVAVRAGYRLVSIDGTIEGYSVDGVLDGFFVGGSVNF
jgi:hypothetical protein